MHTDVSLRIPLNSPCVVVMWPVVKLLSPLIIINVIVSTNCIFSSNAYNCSHTLIICPVFVFQYWYILVINVLDIIFMLDLDIVLI